MLTDRQRRELRRTLRREELERDLDDEELPVYGQPLVCPAHGRNDLTPCTCADYRWRFG